MYITTWKTKFIGNINSSVYVCKKDNVTTFSSMTLLILYWYGFLLCLGRQDQVQYTEEMEMFQDVDDDDPYLSREKLR